MYHFKSIPFFCPCRVAVHAQKRGFIVFVAKDGANELKRVIDILRLEQLATHGLVQDQTCENRHAVYEDTHIIGSIQHECKGSHKFLPFG
jgi:hypothetical protein